MRFISIIVLLLSSVLFPQPSKVTCQQLVHLGDSTTISMSPWLRSDYERLGFSNVQIHAVNGGSIWYPSGQSGLDAARRYKKPGTCWVDALGTNDSASTSASNWNARFDSIMAVIGQDPVVWVNVWYDSPTRPSYNRGVATWWNVFLLYKQSKYNIEIVDWATPAKRNSQWFLSDGLHYTSTGSRGRSFWITVQSALKLPVG